MTTHSRDESLFQDMSTTKVTEQPEDQRTCLFFDLESTGLSVSEDHIVQIGIVTCIDGKDYTFESLIRPGRPMHPEAAKKTGITDEMLVGAREFEPVWAELLDWLRQLPPHDPLVLVAYNGYRFDLPMLLFELRRHKISFRTFCHDHAIASVFDPLVHIRRIPDSSFRRSKTGRIVYTLESIHISLFGTGIEHAHTALADTLALKRVCNHDVVLQIMTKLHVLAIPYSTFIEQMISKFTASRTKKRPRVEMTLAGLVTKRHVSTNKIR